MVLGSWQEPGPYLRLLWNINPARFPQGVRSSRHLLKEVSEIFFQNEGTHKSVNMRRNRGNLSWEERTGGWRVSS